MTEQDVRTAPPRPQRITRRGLQITLGVLWLLDGALQLQPFMFGPGFAQQVLAPAADGQPGWVAAGVHWAASIVGAHPAPWNTVFAVAQIAIGIGLLYRPLVRIALTASIGWAVAVWYFGEGLGGLASGSGSLLTGAPGAVILYAVFALVVWPQSTDGWLRHDSSGAPPRWTPIAWAVIWVGGAVLQALPGQNTPTDLADSLSGDDMPVWQMGLNDSIANHVREFGAQDNWLLLVVLLAIGLCALGGRRARTFAGWAGALVATVFWLVGQGFGDLFSGQATDPNTGPVLLLFSLALLGVPAPEPVDELDVVPAWRSSAMAGTAAIAVALVGLLQWGTTRVPAEQAHIVITDVYTPAGSATAAPVYFKLTNSGNASDTLMGAGTEFQTSGMVQSVSVCANPVCTGPGSITIPAHSTVVFGVAGPHLVAHGTGTFAKGHQPLQLTLDFAGSGVLHVLSPIGAADDLTENDVMTYGFMGHKDPGMGGDMPGMDMSGSGGASQMPTMPGMDGKPAGGG